MLSFRPTSECAKVWRQTRDAGGLRSLHPRGVRVSCPAAFQPASPCLANALRASRKSPRLEAETLENSLRHRFSAIAPGFEQLVKKGQMTLCYDRPSICGLGPFEPTNTKLGSQGGVVDHAPKRGSPA